MLRCSGQQPQQHACGLFFDHRGQLESEKLVIIVWSITIQNVTDKAWIWPVIAAILPALGDD